MQVVRTQETYPSIHNYCRGLIFSLLLCYYIALYLLWRTEGRKEMLWCGGRLQRATKCRGNEQGRWALFYLSANPQGQLTEASPSYLPLSLSSTFETFLPPSQNVFSLSLSAHTHTEKYLFYIFIPTPGGELLISF